MTFKGTATIVGVGAVLVAWLAGAATSKRPIPPPIVTPAQAIDARGIELTNEIAKLRDRLRPTTQPTPSRRNLFTFRAAVLPPVVTPTVASLPPAAVDAPPPSSAPALKLAGIAEDLVADVPDRTAIISGGGQLFMVKEGDQVGAHYRVARISADAVELTDIAAGTVRRLVLK